jgi:hypothetical protein
MCCRWIIHSPHLLVWATSERRVLALVATSGSYWLNSSKKCPLLVGIIHWWPELAGVGSVLVSHCDFYGGHHCPTYMMKMLGMVITCILTSMYGHYAGFTTENLWFVHMVQFCCPATAFDHWRGRTTRQVVVHRREDVEQAKMLVWIIWHLAIVASSHGVIPNSFTSGSWRNVGVIGAWVSM